MNTLRGSSRLALIITLLFSILGFVVQSTTAQAASERGLIASGPYRIVDKDGGWSGDDVKRGSFRKEYRVSTTHATDMYQSICSDEVRGELDLEAILHTNGNILVQGVVRYYEGTNCTTNQIHRSKNVNIIIRPNTTVTRSFYLSDSEGSVSFTIHLANVS